MILDYKYCNSQSIRRQRRGKKVKRGKKEKKERRKEKEEKKTLMITVREKYP